MTFRRKTCPHCRAKLEAGQRIHPDCIDGYAEAEAAKAKRKAEKQARMAAKVERATTRARKQADLTPKKLEQKLQPIFNMFIRLRDRDQPCISCGVMDPPMTSGGQWDAGHFKGVGAFPELRFDEDNCHKQCKKCNGGSGKFAHKARTVSQQYELNIVERIGQERLDRLNGPHPTAKRTREWLLERIDHYRAKLKAMKETA